VAHHSKEYSDGYDQTKMEPTKPLVGQTKQKRQTNCHCCSRRSIGNRRKICLTF